MAALLATPSRTPGTSGPSGSSTSPSGAPGPVGATGAAGPSGAGPRFGSRTGWGAALTLGVGALLPAALAPGGAHQGAASTARPYRPFRATVLAQDAASATVRPLDRAGLRFAEGPWGQGQALAQGSARVPGQGQGQGPDLGQDRDSGPEPGGGGSVLWPVPVPSITGWVSPAPGARISQLFGVPDSEYAAGYHTGVDFAVPTGTPLLAVAPATVETAGWGGAYGNWIVLRLPDGHYALYAHMSRLDVHTGQHVAAGEQLGLSGNTGHTTGPHLHFEIRTQNHYGAVIDPLPYLQAHGCRFQ